MNKNPQQHLHLQQINNKKNVSELLDKFIFLIGIIFPIIFILPSTEILLDSSPSSIGFAEAIVLLSHSIIGLSYYFVYFLFIRYDSLKIILGISLCHLIISDINIFLYCKAWLIIGILIVRSIQLYGLILLYISNIRKSKFLISIAIILILVGWFFLIQEF